MRLVSFHLSLPLLVDNAARSSDAAQTTALRWEVARKNLNEGES